jgi:hypothetical protein
MRRLIPALAVAATLVTAPAVARDIRDDVTGPGGIDCGSFEFLVAPNDKTAQQTALEFLDWAHGFMSSSNLALGFVGQTKKNLNAWPYKQQLAYLRHYCDLHRDHAVIDAVSALFKDLPEAPKRAAE